MVHSGLHIAKICVIFTLSPHLGAFPHLLTHIHWFIPICVWDNEVGMYWMGRSTRNHKPHAVVVSSVATVMTDVFRKNGITMSLKLLKPWEYLWR